MKKKKKRCIRNKPEYLHLAILESSRIVMYEFWYNFMKLKYREKAKLCYIDTDTFIVYIKTRGQCKNC